MIDLSEAIFEAANKLIASGKIEAAIEKQLEETVGRIIEEHLRSYSDFGKALAGHIKAAIGVNLEGVTIPEYNTMIADIVARRVDALLRKEGREALDATLSEILKPAPAEMKLSELIETFKLWVVQQYDYEPKEDGQITVIVEGKPGKYDSRWIYFDRKSNTEKYKCEFSFLVSWDSTVSYIRMRGHNTKDDIFIGGYYGFERDLFRLHAAKTKLVIDEYDTCLPEQVDE
jgi:hypothetical protein